MNDTPEKTPRPFDKNRDGLVIGEGAGCLVLEEYEHALARGATIYAEVIGYASNTDGEHVTRPNSEMMERCMRMHLKMPQFLRKRLIISTRMGLRQIKGDVAETQATARIFGKKPISSLKSYFGHTLGACGAIEAWLSIEMLQRQQFIHTLNLDEIDPLCGDLDYIVREPRDMNAKTIMTNNFAFGGINTSIILKHT